MSDDSDASSTTSGGEEAEAEPDTVEPSGPAPKKRKRAGVEAGGNSGEEALGEDVSASALACLPLNYDGGFVAVAKKPASFLMVLKSFMAMPSLEVVEIVIDRESFTMRGIAKGMPNMIKTYLNPEWFSKWTLPEDEDRRTISVATADIVSSLTALTKIKTEFVVLAWSHAGNGAPSAMLINGGSLAGKYLCCRWYESESYQPAEEQQESAQRIVNTGFPAFAINPAKFADAVIVLTAKMNDMQIVIKDGKLILNAISKALNGQIGQSVTLPMDNGLEGKHSDHRGCSVHRSYIAPILTGAKLGSELVIALSGDGITPNVMDDGMEAPTRPVVFQYNLDAESGQVSEKYSHLTLWVNPAPVLS